MFNINKQPFPSLIMRLKTIEKFDGKITNYVNECVNKNGKIKILVSEKWENTNL